MALHCDDVMTVTYMVEVVVFLGRPFSSIIGLCVALRPSCIGDRQELMHCMSLVDWSAVVTFGDCLIEVCEQLISYTYIKSTQYTLIELLDKTNKNEWRNEDKWQINGIATLRKRWYIRGGRQYVCVFPHLFELLYAIMILFMILYSPNILYMCDMQIWTISECTRHYNLHKFKMNCSKKKKLSLPFLLFIQIGYTMYCSFAFVAFKILYLSIKMA